jgi:regulator of RNase E activity RraA
MVYETNNNTVAHFGDITARIVKKNGCIGVVLPGYTRDARLINLPIFCYGTLPIDAYGKWQLTEYRAAIKIKNVKIYPKDIIFADESGILVIPYNDKLHILKHAERRLKQENKMRKIIKNKKFNINKMYKDIGRW